MRHNVVYCLLYFFKKNIKIKEKENLTPAEIDVMNIVWELQPITVREVLNKINFKKKEKVVRTTVLKHVQRLEEKGWLLRDGNQRPAKYSATERKSTTLSNVAKNFRDRFFSGSNTSLVRTLFGESGLSDVEKEELRKLIDDK